jgi:hypothetical protein
LRDLFSKVRLQRCLSLLRFSSAQLLSKIIDGAAHLLVFREDRE